MANTLTPEELNELAAKAGAWAASPEGQAAVTRSLIVALEMQVAEDERIGRDHAQLPIMHRPVVDVGSIFQRGAELDRLKRELAKLETQCASPQESHTTESDH